MGNKTYPRWLARLLRRRRPEAAGEPARKSFVCDGDASKHAIAVAAATAAVAEAALAAAKAAAEVVRLTSRASGRWSAEEYTAAVKIQSAFRGYLARRALRALRGLVKLQALVRGHFVRKRSAEMLRRMQAMVRLQARARASRIHGGQSTGRVTKEPKSTRKLDKQQRSSSRKLNLQRCGPERPKARTEEGLRVDAYADGEKADKILEIDNWRPRLTLKPRRNHPSSEVASTMDYYYDTYDHRQSFAASDSHARYAMSLNINSRSPCNSESFVSLRSLNLPSMLEQDFSPQACSRPSSSHSKGRTMSPMTPARKECSRNFYRDGAHVRGHHPSYMENTESFRAKVRSQSAPRQRAEWLQSRGSRKWLSAYGSEYRVSRSYSRRDLNL